MKQRVKFPQSQPVKGPKANFFLRATVARLIPKTRPLGTLSSTLLAARRNSVVRLAERCWVQVSQRSEKSIQANCTWRRGPVEWRVSSTECLRQPRSFSSVSCLNLFRRSHFVSLRFRCTLTRLSLQVMEGSNLAFGRIQIYSVHLGLLLRGTFFYTVLRLRDFFNTIYSKWQDIFAWLFGTDSPLFAIAFKRNACNFFYRGDWGQ